MGIGPEFIRREVIADGVSGTLDGVPQERMDRTPSSPIVVEPAAVLPSPTVRTPIKSPAREGQRSVSPAATVVLPVEQPLPAGTPSTRLDSIVSARFFKEGEQQEANGWEDSPLTIEPFPDEEPPKISSFDRVPHHRAPLLVTTFLLGTGLVIGLAVEGADAGAARAWLASEAGPRAVEVWHRAKAGLAIHLTPESSVASARAMAGPAQLAAPVIAPAALTAPAAPEAPEAAAAAVAPAAVAVAPAATVKPAQAADEPSTSNVDLWAPLVAAPPAPRRSDKLITSRRQAPELWHRAAEAQARPAVAVARLEETTPGAERAALAAPADEAKTAASEGRVEPRHGLVWSPAQQRLVPAESASAEVPATAMPSRNDEQRAGNAGDGSKGPDKDVLPLDDEAHATY